MLLQVLRYMKLDTMFQAELWGIQVSSVGWGEIKFSEPITGWRVNVIGFSGGIFAVLFLIALYLFSRRIFSLIRLKTEQKTIILGVASTIVQAIILSDLLLQSLAAILEGMVISFYNSLVNGFPLIYLSLFLSAGIFS